VAVAAAHGIGVPTNRRRTWFPRRRIAAKCIDNLTEPSKLETDVPTSAYIQSALFLLIAAVALFASAGTVAVVGFWLFLAIQLAGTVASFVLLPPDLVRERMRPGGQKPPLGLRLSVMVIVVAFVIAGLDRGRFHWSDDVPPWLQALSLVALAASYAFVFWAMAVNRFFSSIVRIQADRGQHVVASGPYAYVRHPGYLGAIVMTLCSGPALGSWLAAAIFVACGLPFLIHRAVTEDRVLRAELRGYAAYAARVRWRLVPGIW
jgi:protein-S-isoprenylcysteine O-methyltransferase Ste14